MSTAVDFIMTCDICGNIIEPGTRIVRALDTVSHIECVRHGLSEPVKSADYAPGLTSSILDGARLS